MKRIRNLTNRWLSSFLAIAMVITGISLPQAALQVKAEESNKIDLQNSAELTITSGIGESTKNNIIDGDKNSRWESWEDGATLDMPQEIILKLDNPYDLEKIIVSRDRTGNEEGEASSYDTNTGEGNGRLQRYRVSVSKDGVSYFPEYEAYPSKKSGNFPVNEETQNWHGNVAEVEGTITFNNDKTQGEYQYDSTFEFSSWEDVDVTDIQYVKVELLESATFSSKTYADYVRLAEIELYGNLDAETELEKAREELNQVIAQCDTLEPQEYYTQDSWQNMSTCLSEATAVYSQNDATLEDILSAKTALEAALEELTPKVVDPLANGPKIKGFTQYTSATLDPTKYYMFVSVGYDGSIYAMYGGEKGLTVEPGKLNVNASVTAKLANTDTVPTATYLNDNTAIDMEKLYFSVEALESGYSFRSKEGNFLDINSRMFTTEKTGLEVTTTEGSYTIKNTTAGRVLYFNVKGEERTSETDFWGPTAKGSEYKIYLYTKNGVEFTLDTAALQAEVDTANYVKENYNIKSWNSYEAALTRAQSYLTDDTGLKQEDIDDARSKLAQAKLELSEKPVYEIPAVYKSFLHTQTTVAEGDIFTIYTNETDNNRILHASGGAKTDKIGLGNGSLSEDETELTLPSNFTADTQQWEVVALDNGKIALRSLYATGNRYLNLTESSDNNLCLSETPVAVTVTSVNTATGTFKIAAEEGYELAFDKSGNAKFYTAEKGSGTAIRLYKKTAILPELADTTAPTGTTQGQPLASGTGNSQKFRIPASITLSDGTLFVAADARWNHGADAWNDIIVSKSTDKGANWEFSFASYNPDSTNAGHSYASTYIDPVLVRDENDKIYLVADLFPGGVANAYTPHRPEASSGYENINGKKRMVLYTTPEPEEQSDNSYVYYVGDYGTDGLAPIYEVLGDNSYSEEASFYMDTKFYLYTEEKEPMYCPQIGNESQLVQQNVFFYNSLLNVRCAMYIYMISSTDGGKTWTDPVILNPQIRKEENIGTFFGVGPGPGLYLEDGTIMIPCYGLNNGVELACFIYSTDNGKTWKRSEDTTTAANWSSESVLVQIDATTVRQFYRSGSSHVQYTDFTLTNGEWKAGDVVNLNDVPRNAGCQVSAIRYSKTIDGKPVILYSAPGSVQERRKDGKIYVFTVDMEAEGKPLSLVATYDVVPNDTGDAFAYSSLSELNDGSIAILYEYNDGVSIKYENIPMSELAPDLVFDGEEEGGEDGGEVVTVDKAALRELVETHKDKQQDNFTEASFNSFTTALNAAKEVLEKEDATQEQVNKAKADLEAAIENLESEDIESEDIQWGDILEKDRKDLENVPNGIWIAGIEDLEYSGTKQVQEFRVYDKNVMLQEKVDYTATIKNNLKAYDKDEDQNGFEKNKAPQVVLKMKGDYKGTKYVYFKILPVSVSDNSVIVDDIHVSYNGKKQNPAPTITWNGKKLTKNDFYIKEYQTGNGNFVGNETERTKVDLTIVGKGNFAGERPITLTIGKKNVQLPMDKVKVTEVPKKVPWDEEKAAGDQGITLTGFVVRNGRTILKEGEDFKVSYANNKEAGTATLILTGLENSEKDISFHGVKRISFNITGTAMSSVEVNNILKEGYPYTGKPIEPMSLGNITVTLKKGGDVPKEAYEVDYEKNLAKGTASIILTGNPEFGYTGTKKVSFKITAANLDGTYKISMEEALIGADGKYEVPYTAGGATPEVTVTDAEGKELILGTDYTVSYKNNKAVTTASTKSLPVVEIKGKGNYAKSTKMEFNIVKKTVVDGEGIVTISVKDKIESRNQNGWKQSFKVLDVSGKALTKNDYLAKEAKYYLIVENGTDIDLIKAPATPVKAGDTIKIEVTLDGNNYEGSISETYRILEKDFDISKASFKIKAKDYTGSLIMLDSSDIEKAELKKKPLTLDTHFEIVGYENNVKKGTAKVTFRGIGSYGGEKTVTFKINQKDGVKSWWSGVIEAIFETL